MTTWTTLIVVIAYVAAIAAAITAIHCTDRRERAAGIAAGVTLATSAAATQAGHTIVAAVASGVSFAAIIYATHRARHTRLAAAEVTG